MELINWPEAQFTPGPWMHDKPADCGSEPTWGVWDTNSGGPICFVGDPYPRGENAPFENMVAIAALPWMYDALMRAKTDPNNATTWAAIDHALALANGEPQ